MKIFNNLQELWKYCKRCPFCQKSWRAISVTCGPDTFFRKNTFYKVKNNILYIHNQNTGPIFEIDMISNKFTYHGRLKSHGRDVDPFFYLQSTCRKCNNSTTYSNDTDLLLNNNTYMVPFSLEGEWGRVQSDKRMIEIQHIYNDKITYIYDYLIDGDKRIRVGEPLILNQLDLDFSIGRDLLYKKLETILTFS